MPPKFKNTARKPALTALPLIHAKFQQALALHQTGQLAQAQALYQDILKVQPKHFDALHLLGVAAYQAKNSQRAVELIRQAIKLNPNSASAHSNLGLALHELKQFDDAVHSYDRALALKPDFAEAHSNRGNSLQKVNRISEAVVSYSMAVEHRPNYAEAHTNLGAAFRELGQLSAALSHFEQALLLNPNYADAKWNKSLTLLLNGNFFDGLPLYEWRWYGEPFASKKRSFSQPLWLGHKPLAGKSVLLYSEQGLGDTLQFCRYAKLVADLGASVILEVQPPLIKLLDSIAGVSVLVSKGELLPRFDYQCPLMSLPLAFKTDLGDIPSTHSYLSSDPAKTARWSAKLGNKTKPRIGLVWSGSSTHHNDHNRSMLLADLMRQLPLGYEYVSLQKDIRDTDRSELDGRENLLHFEHDLNDFADTAALCSLMDLVVSVDTSVAHLSGALGKPTWVLLPYTPDWRWMLGRNDSPWYPTLALYRQVVAGNWDDVLNRVATDLSNRLPLEIKPPTHIFKP